MTTFAAWLTGQTHREGTVGRVALAVANHVAEGWTPRSGNAAEVMALAPVLALDVSDVETAEAVYWAGHMPYPWHEERRAMREGVR